VCAAKRETIQRGDHPPIVTTGPVPVVHGDALDCPDEPGNDGTWRKTGPAP